jgi:hypothetical protein
MDLAANLVYRDQLYRACAASSGLRGVVLDRCRDDPMFFIRSFGWLQETRLVAEWMPDNRYEDRPVIPFVPRPYQERAMLRMVKHLGHRDIIAPKARETGVSWMSVALAVWDWHFNGAHIGFVSKDEPSVDSTGPGSLFSKFQFFVDHLPIWMCNSGDYVRNIANHTFTHHVSGGSLDGVSSGPNIFRGDRKKWVLMDEAHFFPKESDYLARDSLVGVTRSRVMVSTLNRERGASGAFYEAWQDPDAHAEIIEIDWTEDEDKRRGLYTSEDGQLKIIDKDFWSGYKLESGGYKHPYSEGEYQFERDGRQRSLYYDYEGRRAGVNRQTLAAELDRDVTGATAQLCDGAVLRRASAGCVDPLQEGTLVPLGDSWEWDWSYGSDASLWSPLVDDRPVGGEYVMGADISAGTGGSYSSYSCLAVFDRSTGHQVFQWRSNRVNPLVFASLARFVGLWFHEAYFVPEANGPLGTMFIEELMKRGYPNIYLHSRGKKTYQVKGDRPGYWNQDGGAELLTTLESGIQQGRAVVKSRLCLKEMANYFYRNGKLIQARAYSAEDEGARGKAHGDMAIATGAAWWGVRDLPKWKKEKPKQEIPVDCFLARQREFREQKIEDNKSYWRPWK